MTNLAADQGCAKEFTFYWKNSSGVAVDISGYKIRFGVAENRKSTSVIFERSNTLGGGSDDEIAFVTDGTDGGFIVKTTESNNTALEVKTYVWEIKYDNADGQVRKMGEGRYVVSNTWVSDFV